MDRRLRELLERALTDPFAAAGPPEPAAWADALTDLYFVGGRTNREAATRLDKTVGWTPAKRPRPKKPIRLATSTSTVEPARPRPTPPPKPPSPRPAVAPVAPSPPPSRRRRRYAPWVAAGIGALVLVNVLGRVGDRPDPPAERVEAPAAPAVQTPDEQDGREPEPASAGPLQYGELRAGRVGRRYDYEEWPFRGNTGDVVTVEIRGTGRLFVRLELLAPDGTILFPRADDRARAGCGADIHGHELATSGEHVVRVISCASGADYRVRVRAQE